MRQLITRIVSSRALKGVFLFGFLVMALNPIGCLTRQRGLTPLNTDSIRKGVTTKSEVYRTLGVPSDIFVSPDESTMLLYHQDTDRGSGLGLGYGFFPLLTFQHEHTGTDTFYVLIGPNQVVQQVDSLEHSDLAPYRLWPFGE